jgi:hypothetical protein
VYASAEELAHTSMHRAGHAIYLLVSASIKGCDASAYNGYYPRTRRAERVSAFIGLYQGDEHEFHKASGQEIVQSTEEGHKHVAVYMKKRTPLMFIKKHEKCCLDKGN